MIFEIVTTLVVLGVFAVFYFYAQKAEKYVVAQAKAKREMQRNMLINEASLPKSMMKRANKKKTKIIA